MRLLNVDSLELKRFKHDERPPYAILSHTWGEAEVTYEELLADRSSPPTTHGWQKLLGLCDKARSDGYKWIWIDTCNIDKGSSSELSEAINSMFTWYQNAEICYAYFEDVDPDRLKSADDIKTQLRAARWFTRGWTLQELIAPSKLELCAKNWTTFGTRTSFSRLIWSITSIDQGVLEDPKLLSSLSTAHRMSWAAHRETERPEDIAYCLMGIFGINMPLLYGEGENAFIRLQETIIEAYEDPSIFAWTLPSGTVEKTHGMLAEHPRAFHSASEYLPFPSNSEPYEVTNRGLRFHASLLKNESRPGYLLPFSCRKMGNSRIAAVSLRPIPGYKTRFYRDASEPMYLVSQRELNSVQPQTIYVHKAGQLMKKSTTAPYIFLRDFSRSDLHFIEGLQVSLSQDPSEDEPKVSAPMKFNPMETEQTTDTSLTFRIAVAEFETTAKSWMYGNRVRLAVRTWCEGTDLVFVEDVRTKSALFEYLEKQRENWGPESKESTRFTVYASRSMFLGKERCVVDIVGERSNIPVADDGGMY